jgi:hypothetical protein
MRSRQRRYVSPDNCFQILIGGQRGIPAPGPGKAVDEVEHLVPLGAVQFRVAGAINDLPAVN